MSQLYNIYCDESCHLEHDPYKVMTLGAIWCLSEKTREIALRLREIRSHHGLPEQFEVKWTKVSPAGVQFYLDLVDYFFDDDDLHFRALIVPDKSKLRHADFNQDHDTWYYKMYFDMLKAILTREDRYRIYLDIKDTHGGAKVRKLQEVLSNSKYDFSGKIIERIQIVRSNEVGLIQLTDLLTGLIAAANRKETKSAAKTALIQKFQSRSRLSLDRTTFLREEKVNLFVWLPSEGI